MNEETPQAGEERVRELIALKRHESPQEGFEERFLEDFRQRQRSEVLRGSARSLLWERVETFFCPDGSRFSLTHAAGFACVVVGMIGVVVPIIKPEPAPVVKVPSEAAPGLVPVGGARVQPQAPAYQPVTVFRIQRVNPQPMEWVDLREAPREEEPVLIEF